MSLFATIVQRKRLGASEVARMYSVFSQSFAGVNRDTFVRDLQEKQDVILLYDAAGRIQGFSTATVIDQSVDGNRVRAIFSGDTIVSPEHWGDMSLAQAFIRLAAGKKAENPDQPLYWFLIVKGHRTYRYLPLFFRTFYPSWIGPTPRSVQTVLDTLATRRFGALFDHHTGTVRFPVPGCRLTDALAAVPNKDIGRRDVQFFLERNPGYRRGDELVCLAEIDEANLLPFARRGFHRALAA